VLIKIRRMVPVKAGMVVLVDVVDNVDAGLVVDVVDVAEVVDVVDVVDVTARGSVWKAGAEWIAEEMACLRSSWLVKVLIRSRFRLR